MFAHDCHAWSRFLGGAPPRPAHLRSIGLPATVHSLTDVTLWQTLPNPQLPCLGPSIGHPIPWTIRPIGATGDNLADQISSGEVASKSGCFGTN